MTSDRLRRRYMAYIDCLNARAWERLGTFVTTDVRHNDRELGVTGYRSMLEQDVEQIPDLHFDPRLVVVTDTDVAARLWFSCTPVATFLGVDVDGRRVGFAEHAIYSFRDDRICEVWSIVDKAGLEASLAG